jgi:hypothetical protein
MSFDPGTIIAIAAALLFYLRLIILQRQKVKQLSSGAKTSGKKKAKDQQQSKTLAASIPRLDIYRPYLVGLGVVLVLLGAALTAAPWFDESIRTWWWFPVTIGISLMSLGIR